MPSACTAFSSPTATTTTTTAASSSSASPLDDFDYHKNDKLPWIEGGYKTWKWRGHDINYIEMGDPTKPALILIHGFGASAFHYRYNIPNLARDYHVYAFCKLGFGLSSKPVQDYAAEVWRDQTVDFLKQVVQKPAVLAGNSLGGFTSLYTAATDDVKSLVKGVVLMNGAGRFRDSAPPVEEEKKNGLIVAVQKFIQRAVISASFIVTKQPARIEQILKQVYPINNQNVDAELVESIRYPSLDKNAAEVFYRVITKNGSGPAVYIDDLLEKLDAPLLLCWGEHDPWVSRVVVLDVLLPSFALGQMYALLLLIF
jgi:pimeloyl-ACP methyl ester carboxylesterase